MAKKKAISETWCSYERNGDHVSITLTLADPRGDIWTMRGSCTADPDAIELMRAHLIDSVHACWRA